MVSRSVISTGVAGEDSLEDGGGGASVDVELSPMCTSPSLSYCTPAAISEEISIEGTGVNVNLSFPLEGERHGDGGT